MSPVRSYAFVVLAVLALSGCKLPIVPNFENPTWDDEIADRGHHLFLGIVVDTTRTDDHGLRIERVLTSSPAAIGGLQPGDMIARLGAAPIRTSADLAAQLAIASKDQDWRAQDQTPGGTGEGEAIARSMMGVSSDPDDPGRGPHVEFEVTLFRGGQEEVVEVSLGSARYHAARAVAHMQETSEARKSGIWIPFVIDITKQTVSQEDWLGWFGRRVTEPPVVYDELDIVPAWFASLWRQEVTPLDGEHRLTIGRWPLRLTWNDEPGEYLAEITAEGEHTRAIH
jgi:hypothetical protein